MCLIVLHCISDGSPMLKRDEFENAWAMNPHGGGLAWNANEKLVISKGYFQKRQLWKAYTHAYQQADRLLIHFRLATSGVRDVSNCHPFEIYPGLCIAHNGMIKTRQSPQDKRSDTAWYVEQVLRSLPTNFLSYPTLQESIMDDTRGSILAFLDYLGRYMILPENSGFWEGATWFSNGWHRWASAEYSDWLLRLHWKKGGTA